MKAFEIFKDIGERNNGDVYLGVVGPVRVGKSTFIKKFMEVAVIPNIVDEEDNTIQIEVLISSSDMGKVIGKNGKIINSIRTIVQAASSLEDNKRVKINVDSY